MNEDFIMEIPKAFKKGFCKRLIKKFEDNPAQHSKGVIGNAKENGQKVVAPKVKDDTEIQFDPSYLMSDWKDDLTIITKQVAVNMKKYVEKYSFTELLGRRNTVLQQGKLEKMEENHVVKIACVDKAIY